MMTRYGKPRWPFTVLFGSYRELNYRLEIKGGKGGFFRVRTQSGPGFRVNVFRSTEEGGFRVTAETAAARKFWLSLPLPRRALQSLLAEHFSELRVRPESMVLICNPETDLLPEGSQLTWCLSLVYELWTASPAEQRRMMRKADFLD